MQIVSPHENTLKGLFQGKVKSVLVVSPYVSPAGLQMLSRIFIDSPSAQTGTIEFWIRLSREDHSTGLTNYHTLAQFLDMLRKHARIKIKHSERLHAKIYMTTSNALVGSSNLTSNGFGGNVEVMVLLDRPEEVEQLRLYVKNTRNSLNTLTIQGLKEFCRTLPNFGSKPLGSEIEKDPIGLEDIFKGPPHHKLPGMR